MSERAREVREQCATLTNPTDPSLPTYPALPEEQTRAEFGLTGSSSTREQSQPTQPDPQPAPDGPGRWLVAIHRDRINGTVLLAGFNPAITEVLRGRRWATLDRDRGWTIPVRYLEHVERLLDGADVDLFDVDGQPTPAQSRRSKSDEKARTAAVMDELRAAREAAEADPAAVARAREETKRAFADAIAANYPEEGM